MPRLSRAKINAERDERWLAALYRADMPTAVRVRLWAEVEGNVDQYPKILADAASIRPGDFGPR